MILKKKFEFDKAVGSFGKLIQNVNDLIRLHLLQVSESNPDVYIFAELWQGKDRTYIGSWCKNLLTYWHLNNNTPVNEIKTHTLGVFNKETGDLMATYNMEKGLILK